MTALTPTLRDREGEFEKYRLIQDRLFESDFDRIVEQSKALAKPATPSGSKGRRKQP